MDRHSLLFVGIASAGVCIVAAALLVSVPAALGLAASPLVLLAVLTSPRFRLFVVLAGGLLVFQSDQNVGVPKYAYIGIVLVALVASSRSVAVSKEPLLTAFRPLVPASILLMVVLLLSSLVAVSNGTSPNNWLRDVLPYWLLGSLPIVGLDASRHLTAAAAERLVGVFGLIAAAGFATDWLSRRNISSLGVGRIILATGSLAALGFAYALTRAGLGPRRFTWFVVASVTLALMLVNGTRTNLTLLVTIAGVYGARAKARLALKQLLSVVLPLCLAAALFVPLLAAKFVNDPRFLQARIGSALNVLLGGASKDPSFILRAEAYRLATEAMRTSPWLGTGPGHRYVGASGWSSSSLDTPWSIPAKFGIIGTATLVLFLLSMVYSAHRVRLISGWSPLLTVGRGWMVCLMGLLPFSPWPEDKGFALAVALYLAAVAADARERLNAVTLAHRSIALPPEPLTHIPPASALTAARDAPPLGHQPAGRRTICNGRRPAGTENLREFSAADGQIRFQR